MTLQIHGEPEKLHKFEEILRREGFMVPEELERGADLFAIVHTEARQAYVETLVDSAGLRCIIHP